MYCIRCGNQLKDGTKYCIFCGTPTAAVKKERPRPTADDASSIPEDFFSRRLSQEEEDFTIRIPNGYVKEEAAAQTAEQTDYTLTRETVREEIREVMEEQAADAAGSEEYTRAVSKDEIRSAQKDIPEAAQTDAESIPEAAQTDAESIPEAAQTDAESIPDIPIPPDYIAKPKSGPAQKRKKKTGQPERKQPERDQKESDEDAEQLMSRRGILFVVIVVVLLFVIALGACVTALRGGSPDAAAGSGSAEVGFWAAPKSD